MNLELSVPGAVIIEVYNSRIGGNEDAGGLGNIVLGPGHV